MTTAFTKATLYNLGHRGQVCADCPSTRACPEAVAEELSVTEECCEGEACPAMRAKAIHHVFG